ncbi:MAG: hypothetical protein H7067_15365 [Burkholderiales bacterium]|nr:hypothetical protein [Opitutaceae bacterium]
MSVQFQYSVGGGPRQGFAGASLAKPRLARANMRPDMAEIDHLAATWLSDALFAYKADITIWRVEGGAAVRVFRGLRRLAPRFKGVEAQTLAYTIEGPWDWLMRRPLVQNQAVPPLEGEGPPVMVPQGLLVLGQDDTGVTVNVGQALGAIIDYAIDIGVPITKGVIEGFDFQAGWDQIRDLQVSDGITRLLQVAPDAVVEWDSTTVNPTINIRRCADLPAVTLALAPEGAAPEDFGPLGYAELESCRIVDRPDLVIPGAWLYFRSTDTNNGVPQVRIDEDIAKAEGALPTDENALVRTIELAGSNRSTSTISQKCVTGIIPVGLGEILTPDDGTDFTNLLKFFARADALKWLLDDGVTCSKLTPGSLVSGTFREALIINEETGEVTRDFPDTSLVRELVEGGITPWMEGGSLNRKGEEQEVTYTVEGTRTEGEGDETTVTPFSAVLTRAFMATNVSTRTYNYAESSDETEGEPVPTGLAASLYAAMSAVQYEGSFTLRERECTLWARPGLVINLTGGRDEWEDMKAIIQNVSYDLTTGTTQVTLGFNRELGAGDLVAIMRSNRRRTLADVGLVRATGRY